jgi:hypothetical protein
MRFEEPVSGKLVAGHLVLAAEVSRAALRFTSGKMPSAELQVRVGAPRERRAVLQTGMSGRGMAALED